VGDLSLDTRIEPVDRDAGRFRARLSRDWEIWGPNGGYLAVIALRAAGELARVERPASFSAHFLSVADFHDVDIAVRVIRAGRRSESLGVSIHQEGKPILEALVRTAAVVPGLAHDVAGMPAVPLPSELRPVQELVPDDQGPSFPFWNNFDVKPVWPERFGEPRRARPPEFCEWYRFTPRARFDDPWLEAARALVMIDTASWPAASQPHLDAPFIAPNIDLAAWFHRGDPESEWLLVDDISPVAEAGLMGTHCRIWSEGGRLLATGGAQLLCVPRAGS